MELDLMGLRNARAILSLCFIEDVLDRRPYPCSYWQIHISRLNDNIFRLRLIIINKSALMVMLFLGSSFRPSQICTPDAQYPLLRAIQSQRCPEGVQEGVYSPRGRK